MLSARSRPFSRHRALGRVNLGIKIVGLLVPIDDSLIGKLNDQYRCGAHNIITYIPSLPDSDISGHIALFTQREILNEQFEPLS